MLLRNSNGHTAVLVRRGREAGYIVPMKSGSLGLKKLPLDEIEHEWPPVSGYDCRTALEKFLAHGRQHGMSDAAAEALREALESLENELPF
jgi:hypothetical protein